MLNFTSTTEKATAFSLQALKSSVPRIGTTARVGVISFRTRKGQLKMFLVPMRQSTPSTIQKKDSSCRLHLSKLYS